MNQDTNSGGRNTESYAGVKPNKTAPLDILTFVILIGVGFFITLQAYFFAQGAATGRWQEIFGILIAPIKYVLSLVGLIVCYVNYFNRGKSKLRLSYLMLFLILCIPFSTSSITKEISLHLVPFVESQNKKWYEQNKIQAENEIPILYARLRKFLSVSRRVSSYQANLIQLEGGEAIYLYGAPFDPKGEGWRKYAQLLEEGIDSGTPPVIRLPPLEVFAKPQGARYGGMSGIFYAPKRKFNDIPAFVYMDGVFLNQLLCADRCPKWLSSFEKPEK